MTEEMAEDRIEEDRDRAQERVRGDRERDVLVTGVNHGGGRADRRVPADRRSDADQGGELAGDAGEPPEVVHATCNTLLAAWGRLGRDFVRMLDAFDDAQACTGVAGQRVDLYNEDAGSTMLEAMQANVV